MAKSNKPWCENRCGKRQHTGDCNVTSESVIDEEMSTQFTGELGAIHSRYGTEDQRLANLLHASVIRSHPDHQIARQERSDYLRDKYNRLRRAGKVE